MNSFIKIILCKLGFHQWTKYGEPYLWEGTITYMDIVQSLDREYEVSEMRQQRECLNCGLIKTNKCDR